MKLQRQHFLLSHFKTLYVGLTVVWTCDLPHSVKSTNGQPTEPPVISQYAYIIKYTLLLYGKASLRQIWAPWLVLYRSQDFAVWNGPICVFLFWSEADKFKIGNQNFRTECHINCNLLTVLAQAVLKNIGPRLFLYGHRDCHHLGPIFPSTALVLG